MPMRSRPRSWMWTLNSPLVKVSRTIHADRRPVAFLIDILPDDILDKAELQTGFTGSVLDLLLQRGSPALANFGRRGTRGGGDDRGGPGAGNPARRCAA